MNEKKYRRLEKGEIIQEGDEVDACVNPWKDIPVWKPVSDRMIGEKAPDPSYPAHLIYRRKVNGEAMFSEYGPGIPQIGTPVEVDRLDAEACERCDGDGLAHGSDRPFEYSGPDSYPGKCPVCKGSKKK